MNDKENLLSILSEFKSLTVSLIDDLRADNYTNIDNVIEQRNILLNKLIEGEYEKEDINTIIIELHITEFNDKLSALLQNNMNNIKQDLDKMSKNKIANTMYNNAYKNPNIFSKKI